MEAEKVNTDEFPLSESIIAVDTNYEIWFQQHSTTKYACFLDRSLRLCLLLTKNLVIQPLAHFYENPTFRDVISDFKDFFIENRIVFSNKVGVGFNEIIEQRLSGYVNYPDHLLKGYRDIKVHKLSNLLSKPIGVRTTSMTQNIEERLFNDLENVTVSGSLGNKIETMGKWKNTPIHLNSIVSWLKQFSSQRRLYGLPILYDVLAQSEGFPTYSPIQNIIRGYLFELYFAEAEYAYNSYACSVFYRNYPPSWRSSNQFYYDLILFWDVLGIIGIQEDIKAMGEQELSTLLYGDYSLPLCIFRDWYESICVTENTSRRIKEAVANVIYGSCDCVYKDISILDVIRDLKSKCQSIGKSISYPKVKNDDLLKTTAPLASGAETMTKCDVGIIIALREEFRELHKIYADKWKPCKDDLSGRCYYFFEEQSNIEDNKYKCVATFVGGMGEKKMALASQRLLQFCDPSVLVMIGIAGGIEPNLRLGDVVLATVVDSYMEESKAVAPKGRRSGYELSLSGDPYRCDNVLIDKLQNIEFSHPDIYAEWICKCNEQRDSGIDTSVFQELKSKTLICDNVTFHKGHIASGPTVGASSEFIEFLINNRDRKYLAIEMESGGMLAAIDDNPKPYKSLVIRGISDYANEKKKELDNINKGCLRKYAVNNAIEFLRCAMKSGSLPK